MYEEKVSEGGAQDEDEGSELAVVLASQAMKSVLLYFVPATFCTQYFSRYDR